MSHFRPPIVVIDFHTDGLPERLIFEEPRDILLATSLEQVRPVLIAAERAASGGFYVAGFVSYEAAPAFDKALVVRNNPSMPLAWFGVFDSPSMDGAAMSNNLYTLTPWTCSVSQDRYRADLDAIQDAIGQGETYQINYTMRLRSALLGDSFALYSKMRAAQNSSYCAYIDTGEHQILSASPELFFLVEHNRIVTRPMKGTVPRGQSASDDKTAIEWLRNSPKNRAENVMIVDLLRNDLGRVAQVGLVTVTSLCEVETYPTLHQMTSTIEAELKSGVTLEQIFAALFPCGSVTGAPKISSTRIIASRETTTREIYCGAIGLIKPGFTEAIFNVAIRTAWIDSATDKIEYGVGGGITADSNVNEEFEEAMTKAKIVDGGHNDFKLLETMKRMHGYYVLLSFHIDRLKASAEYFGFRYDRETVQKALDMEAVRRPFDSWRVRLTLSREGVATIDSQELVEPNPLPLPVRLANKHIDRSNEFFYHKTTNRGIYDDHRVGSDNVYDVLLWNDDGEITEFTTGNIVIEIDNKKITPPISSGLLAGTFRRQLLVSGTVIEQIVAREDLANASRIWLINSVRGWLPVRLIADVG
jgi:para-aminobenzoate synthetase/4-amino-4-deoxychorismate lyase